MWVGGICLALGLIGAVEIFAQWQFFVGTGGRSMLSDHKLHGWPYLVVLLIPFGLYVLVFGLGPFYLRINEHGVNARDAFAGMRVALPWQSIAAMTIERKPGDSTLLAPYLVLWPVPGTNLEMKESYVRDGRPAYALVQLDELREPQETLIAALRQYAGSHFVARPEQTQPSQQYQSQQQPPQYPRQQYPPQYPGQQYPPSGRQ